MEASPEDLEGEPEHKYVEPGWENDAPAKRLSAKSLKRVFGRASEIPDILVSMGYLDPGVVEELFRPKSLGPYLAQVFSKVILPGPASILDGHILKLEQEIVRDTQDLAILKSALAVCQKLI